MMVKQSDSLKRGLAHIIEELGPDASSIPDLRAQIAYAERAEARMSGEDIPYRPNPIGGGGEPVFEQPIEWNPYILPKRTEFITDEDYMDAKKMVRDNLKKLHAEQKKQKKK